jgi:hypothetical protein
MTATGWTDDVVDLPLSYSFAYHVAAGGGEPSPAATPTNGDDAAAAAAAAGDGGDVAAAVVQQIRGRDLAQTSSFSPSAGNGSVVLSVLG